MTKQSEITLDNLTSALKTIYGQETEAVLLIFLHWVKNNYDVANATPEVLQEIKEGYLEKYHTAKPLERPDALELLGVYGEHFLRRRLLKNEQPSLLRQVVLRLNTRSWGKVFPYAS